jgi:sterol 3beta-glucosyltransferase
MKIVIPAMGSRGDVQPYLNLSQGLQAAGHDVTVATNPSLLSLTVEHGVKGAPVGPPIDMGEVGARLMAQSFNNMWIGMIRVMQFGAKLIQEAYPDVLEACHGADLVISTDTTSGIAEAENLSIPWISVTLQPGRIPMAPESPTIFQRTVWPMLGKLLIAPTNRFRKRVGAPPAKDISSIMSRRLILLPVSRHVAPPDSRWPSHIQQSGYWFSRGESEWSPPDDLLEFLGAGERPVAVSLGVMSMSGKQAHAGARIVLQALRERKMRAVIQGWDQALQSEDLSPNIFHAGSMPHDWLFKRVGAVVHHGGFGTTAAVLRSGVPGIVVPHVIDQFYWGQRVNELGVGPRYISRGKLDVKNLGHALLQASSDTSMRKKAAELGEAIRAEPDGVNAAVRSIEEFWIKSQVSGNK